MKIIDVAVKDLKFYPGNPRKIDKGVLDKLKAGIKEYGLVQPLVINKSNEVIGGNQRLKCLQDLKTSKAPCVLVDLSKPREKALNIALNKLQGEWDMEMLDILLKDIMQDIDIESIGFSKSDLKEISFTKALKDLKIHPTEFPHVDKPKAWWVWIDLASQKEMDQITDKLGNGRNRELDKKKVFKLLRIK